MLLRALARREVYSKPGQRLWRRGLLTKSYDIGPNEVSMKLQPLLDVEAEGLTGACSHLFRSSRYPSTLLGSSRSMEIE